MDAQKFIGLMIRVAHEAWTVLHILQDAHGHQRIQILLASAGNPLILHERMAHTRRKLPVLRDLFSDTVFNDQHILP